MDWKERYADKLISIEDAARLVKSGDVVAWPTSSQPREIGLALARRKDELRGVTLVSAWTQSYPWLDAGMEDSFYVKEVFGYRDTSRAGLRERRIDWLPWLPGLCNGVWEGEEGRGRVLHFADITFVTLTPPNKNGYCSFGHDLWNTPTMVRTAKTAVAMIDPNRIWTYGEHIHVSELDYLVEAPAAETGIERVMPLPAEDEVGLAEVIGAHIASLVNDGDTIQVGTGTAAEAVWSFLGDKNDLGVDTEMIYPPTIDLVKAGVITGKRKNINRGKVISTALWTYVGDPRTPPVLDYVDHNPTFEFHEITYVDNPIRIAGNDNMVSINNLLAIDLLGQGVVTHLGPVPICGPGGQVEYTIAPHYSRGGRSISALISTALRGTVSRIVPQLEPGTAIMVPMVYIDYIVTEHGITNLANKSLRERAEALISVAHPDFRPELRKAARRMFWP